MRCVVLLFMLLSAPGAEDAALRWLPGASGRGDRQAVLLIADSYQVADWNLPTLGNNLEAMRGALGEAGYAPAAIRVLRGRDVNADAIRAALTAAAAALDGPQATLLIYATGHGFASADGTPALLTFYSQEANGSLTGTVPTTDLGRWTADALQSAKGQATAALIVDACRNQRLLAPPPQAKLTPLPLWQVFSTDSGRFAAAPPADAPSPFTAALAEVLTARARSGEEASLTRVVDQVRLRLLERGAGQLPRLEAAPAGASEPRLVSRPAPVAFTIAALDASDGNLLDRVSVLIDGQPPAAGTTPGQHRLRIASPGFRTLDTLWLLPNEQGGTLRVPLSPWLVRSKDRFGDVATVTIEGVAVRFRRIPGGSFLRGSPAGEAGRKPVEKQAPAQVVPAWLAETETSQALWSAVMQGNPSASKGADRPVDSVSWVEVQRFLDEVSRRCPGLDARLPGEAEWELAARAGTTTAWSFGDDVGELRRFANFADRRLADADPDRWPGADPAWDDGFAATSAPVASFQANAWGFSDLHGNVAEWCADPFRSDPAGPEPAEPIPSRVARGGSWMSPANDTRSASRLRLPPTVGTPALGFRLVVASPTASP